MKVILNEKKCKCGRTISTRRIDIKSFAKETLTIDENTLKIWRNKKCCWRCKGKPKIGEKWGLSINYNEKNRIFCPGCSEYIEQFFK